MATQSASNANDLLVGAGKWYWYPWDNNGEPVRNDLHHFGDADSAVISKDITTVEHNSSMDKARELMASVKTGETHTLTLNLFEYNPENVAMMLNGTTLTRTQTSATVSNEAHTVSPDMNIRLMDAAGNPYHNVTNVTLSLASATPATVLTNQAVTDSSSSVTGVMTFNGTYTGTTDRELHVQVVAINASNDIDIRYGYAPAGSGVAGVTAWTNDTLTNADGTYQCPSAASGNTSIDGITFVLTDAVAGNYANYGTTGSFNGLWTVSLSAAGSTALTLDQDYIVNEVDIRFGIINIPATSTIPAGTNVLVSYTVPAGTFPVVNGGVSDRTVGLVFVGDPNVGPCYNGEIWKAKVKPSGDLNLIGDDFAATELEFNILSDRLHHPSQPLYTLTKVETNEA